MFLSYCCGHQGPSSSFPCIFCLVPLKDLSLTGDIKEKFCFKNYNERDLARLGSSLKHKPLFPIPLENIVPPVLHIPLGIFNDVFKKILEKVKQLDMAEFFGLDISKVEEQKNCKALFGKQTVFLPYYHFYFSLFKSWPNFQTFLANDHILFLMCFR